MYTGFLGEVKEAISEKDIPFSRMKDHAYCIFPLSSK